MYLLKSINRTSKVVLMDPMTQPSHHGRHLHILFVKSHPSAINNNSKLIITLPYHHHVLRDSLDHEIFAIVNISNSFNIPWLEDAYSDCWLYAHPSTQLHLATRLQKLIVIEKNSWLPNQVARLPLAHQKRFCIFAFLSPPNVGRIPNHNITHAIQGGTLSTNVGEARKKFQLEFSHSSNQLFSPRFTYFIGKINIKKK